ncbi:MAG: DUF4097 family beta strand repeat-containing protein [Acutalibacter sp.]
MKKKWAFTAAAGVLGGLFLAGVLEVGSSTGWFGLEELASPGVPSWEYSYETTWDPSQDGVEGLSVRWAAGPVSVMPGEGPLITVTEYASRPLEEGERLALSSSGGVLEVGWNGGLLPLGALQDLEKRVDVEVPPELLSQLEGLSCWNVSGGISVSEATAQELSLSSLSGDLFLTGVSGAQARASTVSGDIQWAQGRAGELSVETAWGAVRMSGIQAEDFRVKTVTGPVDFQGVGNAISGETVTGALRAQLAACPREGDLRSVQGNISLTLPENQGFQARHSSVSGHFTSDFSGSGQGGGFLYKGGGPLLSFTTTSGDVRIARG